MTQTLKIEIPKGYVIDSFDTQSGEIKFKEKPKSVIERIRTVEDVLADNGLTRDQFEYSVKDLDKDEKAYRLLKLIAKSLNEGWTPDWDNANQYKYVCWFYINGGSSGFRFRGVGIWGSGSGVGSRLCFKTRELAEHAGKNFTEVFKQFMTI